MQHLVDDTCPLISDAYELGRTLTRERVPGASYDRPVCVNNKCSECKDACKLEKTFLTEAELAHINSDTIVKFERWSTIDYATKDKRVLQKKKSCQKPS